jgi:uncharacterized protein YjbI with pentapeptide repeats
MTGRLAAIRRRLRSGLGKFYRWTGFGDRKLMDYIQVIVLPLVFIVGGQFVSQAVNASARQQAQEQALESRLKSYLDEVSRLALDRGLLSTERSRQDQEVLREVARAQTLTALNSMNGPRKQFVIRFLYELGLINGQDAVISLAAADLRGATLDGAELFGVNLDGANLERATMANARLTFGRLNQANLQRAVLDGALLVDTRLNKSDLRLATLSRADLSNASLFDADLRGVVAREANFTSANLISADLRGADLRGADLSGANLQNALVGDDPADATVLTDLSDVTWSGTTCPDGSLSDANGGTCAGHLKPADS